MALLLGRRGPFVNDFASILALEAAFVVTLAAALTYRFIERPFIDYGERVAAYEKPRPTGGEALAINGEA